MPALDALYPIAMSFSLSTARLCIQRPTTVSGAQVDSWRADVGTMPPVTLSCVQRGDVDSEFPGLATECVSQSASVPPRLTYCPCAIARVPRTQRSFPSLAATRAGGFVQAASFASTGPVRVVFLAF